MKTLINAITEECRFEATAASLAGRQHRRARRNNQDAYAVVVLDDGRGAVAAVADGCSSAPRSEVGAALAVRWVGARAPRWVAADRQPAEALAAALSDDLLGYLEGVAGGLVGSPPVPDAAWLGAVHDTLLFTLLVAVMGPERTRVLAIGDGVVGVDGALTELRAGPDGAPDYLGYRLVGLPGAGRVAVVLDRPTASIRALLLGSDGAAALGARALGALLTDPTLTARPSALARHLRRLDDHPEGPRLHDDTTLALLRRRTP